MFTLVPGCGLIWTELGQLAVVEAASQKPNPMGERRSVQKIAAGFRPLTVGLANVVSAFGAAVPVPLCRTNDSQVRGSVPVGGSP